MTRPISGWRQPTPTPAPRPGDTIINVNSYSGLSQISVLADNNIILNTLWTLADAGAPATLNLTAGNNFTVNNGASWLE